MSRKVYVDVVTRVIINVDEGTKVSNVLGEMDYEFSYPFEDAEIVDTEITCWNVIDSK